jgi:hypothetical protein
MPGNAEVKLISDYNNLERNNGRAVRLFIEPVYSRQHIDLSDFTKAKKKR